MSAGQKEQLMLMNISPSAKKCAGQPKANELQFLNSVPFISPLPLLPLLAFYIFVAIIVVKLEITDGQIQSDGKKIVGDLFYFDKKLTLPFVFVRKRLYFSLYHELWNLSWNG